MFSFYKGNCQGSINGGAKTKWKGNRRSCEKDKGGTAGIY